MSKLGYVNLSQNFSDYANQEFYLAGAGFIAVVGIALFLSLFERFEHYFTAIVFGVSMPGLVYGLANLGAVQ